MASMKRFFGMRPKHVLYVDFGFGQHRHVLKRVIW